MNIRQLASRVDGAQGARPAPPGHDVARERSTRFADLLRQAHDAGDHSRLQLSSHAEQRIRDRGIPFDALQKQSVSEALNLLESKGARDALLLRSDAAFVVNVPNRTIVTAMGREDMSERVFTQIDSAMVL